MTLSLYAANDPSGTPLAGVEYRPGVCNIGPAEIARRRRAGHVGLLVTVAAYAVLVAIDAPPLARLILILPAATAASGYLQAWSKFCAGFGSRGIFNLGPVGDTQQVVDEVARARDRARASGSVSQVSRSESRSASSRLSFRSVPEQLGDGCEPAALGRADPARAGVSGVGYTHTLGFDQASKRPGVTWLAVVIACGRFVVAPF